MIGAGKMSSEAGGIDHDALQSLQTECQQLRGRCAKLEQLKQDHRGVLQQLASQAQSLEDMENERKSLLATVQLLQQELLESEEMRLREQRAAPPGQQHKATFK